MWQRRFTRAALSVGLSILLAAVLVSLVWAYAEEPITFRDPYTGEEGPVDVSTIHTDLTYVLALAAGFSIDASRTLMIWDQLVDAEKIATEDGVYTNCLGTFPRAPDEAQVCKDTSGELFWPFWAKVLDRNPGTSCVTSRYGPFEGFFHFPHREGREMRALKAWGWGTNQKLPGYQGYVWGPAGGMRSGFYGATCFYTKPVIIDTGMTPGSLEAFATYLHSLADSYSHQECQRVTDDLGWAWPTHTDPYDPNGNSIYECNYTFLEYLKDIGDSHHGREFGTRWPEDSGRTDQAVRAVYAELVARSTKMEGVYQPLSLDTQLTGRFHKLTLDEALSYYVHKWNFDEPYARRAYASQLAEVILAQRVPVE